MTLQCRAAGPNRPRSGDRTRLEGDRASEDETSDHTVRPPACTVGPSQRTVRTNVQALTEDERCTRPSHGGRSSERRGHHLRAIECVVPGCAAASGRWLADYTRCIHIQAWRTNRLATRSRPSVRAAFLHRTAWPSTREST